jgi:hypothetical protein
LQRNHSAQYISVPGFPWQKLRSESPGKYESYVDLVPGQWTHIKLQVSGTSARLYVNGSAHSYCERHETTSSKRCNRALGGDRNRRPFFKSQSYVLTVFERSRNRWFSRANALLRPFNRSRGQTMGDLETEQNSRQRNAEGAGQHRSHPNESPECLHFGRGVPRPWFWMRKNAPSQANPVHTPRSI